ncbi:MAG: hypothetical protein J6S67_04635 [Methanobrevibacter sp.]|nr:hypothetical protein [Methanobrevibacter sp.]
MKTAFPLNSTPVSIRLYSNIPFDNTYKHHSLISDLFKYNNIVIYQGSLSTGIAKERFIDRIKSGTTYYYPRYNLTGEFNFDFSNGLIGSVVLELTPQQTNANYMRVKVGDATSGYEYYYYFITGINQINADTYRLSLELDVLMTYQDEFLDGMKDIPVFTTRKHCHRYTDDGVMPCCPDLKTGDDTFAGVKPSIIENIYELEHSVSNIKSIKDVKWLYICFDPVGVTGLTNFTCQGIQYPFSMMALPLNCDLVLQDMSGTEFSTYTRQTISNCIINSLINNGKVHGAKISDYPPFVKGSISYSNGVMTIKPFLSAVQSGIADLMIYSVGNALEPSKASTFISLENNTSLSGDIYNLLKGGAMVISEINDNNFSLKISSSFKNQFINTYRPLPTMNRYLDPKLLFSPFKKYILGAKYSANGVEIYPELLFSEFVTNNTTDYFEFVSIATPYISDMSVYTYLKPVSLSGGLEYAFKGYNVNRIGLAGTMNYTMPVGENALEVFKATQQNAFYQSKVASGVTGGLSIAGGIGSIALGVAGAVGSLGMSTPASVGLIAGGVTAIGGGIASIANSVKSTTAKIEDLKNTPDSVNVAGSTFITDYAIDETLNKLPFVSVYGCSSAIKENADDFFYNYGYQVARECYFNTELKYTNSNHKVDNNLFGRTIFNYVQTNDDITNKLNSDMPLIIKQKINAIFNSGITLWSFFNNITLWGSSPTPQQTTNPDNWFMKCILDNSEVFIE